MPCTATNPNLTAREQAQHLYEAIPPGLFRVADENERIAWRVSPEPFALPAKEADAIEALGADLLGFYRALNNLYNRWITYLFRSAEVDWLQVWEVCFINCRLPLKLLVFNLQELRLCISLLKKASA